MKGQNMHEAYFALSIEDWWLVVYIHNALMLDLHLGVMAGLGLIIGGIVLFKRTRNRERLDNSLALLGAVYPSRPGPREHGPRFYKRRRRGL